MAMSETINLDVHNDKVSLKLILKKEIISRHHLIGTKSMISFSNL